MKKFQNGGLPSDSHRRAPPGQMLMSPSIGPLDLGSDVTGKLPRTPMLKAHSKRPATHDQNTCQTHVSIICIHTLNPTSRLPLSFVRSRGALRRGAGAAALCRGVRARLPHHERPVRLRRLRTLAGRSQKLYRRPQSARAPRRVRALNCIATHPRSTFNALADSGVEPDAAISTHKGTI